MTEQHPPRFAIAVLNSLRMDPALIGDLLEEYELRRSRVWLWKQVLVAIAVGLSGRVRSPEPHRWKEVRLAAAPAGAPIGGLGLLALLVLVALVRPQTFWLFVIVLAGGLFVGCAMIIVSRRRQLRRTAGRRNVLLPLVLVAAASLSSTAQTVQRGAEARARPLVHSSGRVACRTRTNCLLPAVLHPKQFPHAETACCLDSHARH